MNARQTLCYCLFCLVAVTASSCPARRGGPAVWPAGCAGTGVPVSNQQREDGTSYYLLQHPLLPPTVLLLATTHLLGASPARAAHPPTPFPPKIAPPHVVRIDNKSHSRTPTTIIQGRRPEICCGDMCASFLLKPKVILGAVLHISSIQDLYWVLKELYWVLYDESLHRCLPVLSNTDVVLCK